MSHIALPNRALDVDEVAAVLHVCTATVRREAQRGHLRGRHIGRRWRFMPADVLAYLDGDIPSSPAPRLAT